jgi:hypothetical protein
MINPEAVPPDFFCAGQPGWQTRRPLPSPCFDARFTRRIRRCGMFLRHLYAHLPKLQVKGAPYTWREPIHATDGCPAKVKHMIVCVLDSRDLPSPSHKCTAVNAARLRCSMPPVDADSMRADGQRDVLQRIAQLIPRASVANCSLGDLGRLCALMKGSLDAGIERGMAALCADVFPDGRRAPPLIPARLRSLRSRAEMAVAAGLRRFAIPADRAGTPPRFR